MDDMNLRVSPEFVLAPTVFETKTWCRAVSAVAFAVALASTVVALLNPYQVSHETGWNFRFLVVGSGVLLMYFVFFIRPYGVLALPLIFVAYCVNVATAPPTVDAQVLWCAYVMEAVFIIVPGFHAFLYRPRVILDESGVLLQRLFGTVTIPWNEIGASAVERVGFGNSARWALVIRSIRRRYEVGPDFDVRGRQELIESLRTAQVGAERQQKPPLDGLGGGTGDIGL